MKLLALTPFQIEEEFGQGAVVVSQAAFGRGRGTAAAAATAASSFPLSARRVARRAPQ